MRALALAATPSFRFKMVDSNQKREPVNLMSSNSTWEDGKLVAKLPEIFDLMLEAVKISTLDEGQEDTESLVSAKGVDWWR